MSAITVTTRGPIWDVTPDKVEAALADAVRDLAAMGETTVVENLYPGHGLITGHYQRSIHTEFRSRLHAEVNDSGVVYGSWLEGTSRRNQTTRFKGYASFRRARQKLERAVEPTVRKALKRIGVG